MDYNRFSLEEQVAQLFMVGYAGAAPNPITRRFLERGVSGLIFFRDNFDSLQPAEAKTVRDLLDGLKTAIPPHLPVPLLGIDQEGGQVERLPHTLFPTAITPRAVALSVEPEALARQMYRMMARHLKALGFNLDFFPTLDVNLKPDNPIIGVRAFGDDPDTVWTLAHIALEAFNEVGLIAVGKHFPGHGNGTVDSHLDLPTLHFTDAELQPFQQAIRAGVPVMLVAHGFYPALQTTAAEKCLPSSASPVVIQGLLRQQCGFEGVIITDDMCMGAITRQNGPIEAALASLRAGVDILLYKQSTEEEWAVYEAVVAAFRSGELPMMQLRQSLARISTLKSRFTEQAPLPSFAPSDFTPEACRQKADAIALAGVSVLAGNPDALPIAPEKTVWLIHPDRRSLGNYAFDVPTSDDLDVLLQQSGFLQAWSFSYPFNQPFSLSDWMASPRSQNPSQKPDTLVFVTFNPLLNPAQAAAYAMLRQQFPETPIILVSAGTPYDRTVMPNPALHLALCSYRPASLRALIQVLQQGLSDRAVALPETPSLRL
jgi:beta-N-acetylhexosaminidase